MTQTRSVKPAEIQQKWWILDVEDVVLGRAAAKVSTLLRGKHKAYYTPNLDCGDHVVIINAEKIGLKGNKAEDKRYYWHTGYPGGINETSPEKILSGEHPERVFFKAVQRMISRNPLGRKQLKKLHVYAGSEHPHTAQQPEVLEFADKNRKNKVA